MHAPVPPVTVEQGGCGGGSGSEPDDGLHPWAKHAPPHPKRRDPAGYAKMKVILIFNDLSLSSCFKSKKHVLCQAAWGERLLAILHRHFPGTARPGAVAFVDVSTPLTIEHFTRPGRGAAVGLDVTPSRFIDAGDLEETNHRHPRVPGLWRAGQDYLMTGQVLAAGSGIVCALRTLGPLATLRFCARALRLLLAPKLAELLARGS